MFLKLLKILALLVVTVILYVLDLKYPNIDLENGYTSFFIFTIVYIIFSVGIDELVVKKFHDSKTRYSLRKGFNLLSLVITVILVIRIWMVNTQAITLAYGLLAAGLAISLQDLFKNFVGGIILLTRGIYKVGDRIEVSNKFGDVMDVGLLYSTLLELRGWVDGDQATGRIVIIPNGFVLSQPINNYTHDHSFIWDEIHIPVTYQSNWQKAVTVCKEIAMHETKTLQENAEKEISKIEEKYFLSKRNMETMVFVNPTDNWISLNIRYVSDVSQRRLIHNQIVQKILSTVAREEDITIASQTVAIVDFPQQKISKAD